MKSMSGMALGVAAAVFGASAVLFGASVFGAVRTDGDLVLSAPASTSAQAPEAAELAGGPEAEVEPGPGSTPVQPLRGITYPRVSNDEILGAVNQDLFQPDRTPSIQRYLLPSERAAPVQASRNDRRRREPNVRIVGTAIAGDRAIVMVQVDDSIPFAVLLGEEVDGYLVAAVSEESVTLTGNDSEFSFPVVEPQRGRGSNDRSDNSRNRNTRNTNATEAASQALAERVQQMLQGRGQMQGGRAGGGLQIPRVTEMSIAVPVRRPGGGSGEGGSVK